MEYEIVVEHSPESSKICAHPPEVSSGESENFHEIFDDITPESTAEQSLSQPPKNSYIMFTRDSGKYMMMQKRNQKRGNYHRAYRISRHDSGVAE
jgi:hypothetical protein